MGSKKIEKESKGAAACALAGSMGHLLVALDKKFGLYDELHKAYREVDPDNSKAYFHKAKATAEAAALLGNLLEACGVVEIERKEAPEDRLLRAVFGGKHPRRPGAKGKAAKPSKDAEAREPGDRAEAADGPAED